MKLSKSADALLFIFMVYGVFGFGSLALLILSFDPNAEMHLGDAFLLILGSMSLCHGVLRIGGGFAQRNEAKDAR